MRKPAAMKIALLALMLAVSHIALISHVTAHFQPELEQCELCVSQAQLLSCGPASDHALVVDSQFGQADFESQQCQLPERPCSTHHQRDPPSRSS
jgi:hypothetical protein